jgi:CYTH domain-containing protein
MPDGIEIERKFLVREAPGDLDAHPSNVIEQGYVALTDDGVEVRIRRYGQHSFLTIKSGGARIRLEEEIEIDDRRFRALWPLTEGRRIQKRRYLIATGGGRIELDVYEGRLAGLVTAEVEFESKAAAAAFTAPAWLGSEVSDDPRYKNKWLATHGLPARPGAETSRRAT